MVEAVEILNKKGLILRGYLDLPENAEKIVVMLHGFTGHRMEHNGHFRNLSRLLSKNNIASLRMDYHGNGESDGEFYDFDFDYLLEDAKQMIEFAKNVKGIKEVELLGFSLGGAVASLVADDKVIKKLLSWSPAGNMIELAKARFEKALKLENGNAYFSGFEMSENFVKTIQKYDMYQNTKNFKNPVMVICGRDDTNVPFVFGVEYVVRFANSNLHIIDHAGHGYDTYEQEQELYNKSLLFLK